MDEFDSSSGDEPRAGELLYKYDLVEMKKELQRMYFETSQRGLLHTSKWLSEFNFAIKSVKSPTCFQQQSIEIPEDERDAYYMAKSYFDLKEYYRSSYFSKSLNSYIGMFLHFYSRYLAAEKKHLEDLTQNSTSTDHQELEELKMLRADLQAMYYSDKIDAYLLYLYGMVLRKLSLVEEAIPILCESVHKEPCNWGAWTELSCLVTSKEKLQSLDLPDHWSKQLFIAHTCLELQQNEEALKIYFDIQQQGLQSSTYLLAQVAIAFHNMRQVDQAMEHFSSLCNMDPYRLDNMDTYSNLLYVKEMRVELAYLAHRLNQIGKYRTETCCVIGNYYSISSQHQKAVIYFQRALKLNPNYLSALTLLGHEYMEMKNTNAAIQSYRQAIDANRRDYRAWYGLGQAYELLKMPFYCLYYYKQAQVLRPNDSRMLVALGESYEKLDKLEDAMKCFWKAHCVGDIECGIALNKLARLYQRTGQNDQAAAAYMQYIQETEGEGSPDRDEQGIAYKFLATHYLELNCLDEAYELAMKCINLADVREDGKALVKEIAVRRQAQQAQTPGTAGGTLRGLDLLSPAAQPADESANETMEDAFDSAQGTDSFGGS